MDPKNQQTPIQSGQQAQSTQKSDGVQAPVPNQPVPQAPSQPVQTPPAPIGHTPVSGPAKEHAPIEAPVSDYVQPTEHAPVLTPEVKEAGVEHAPSQERPKLTDADTKAGIEHAKESIAVQTQPTNAVQLPHMPMTSQQVQDAVKGDVSNSKTWFGKLTEFVMKQFNIPL